MIEILKKSPTIQGNQSVLLLSDGEFSDAHLWSSLEENVVAKSCSSESFRIHTISIQDTASTDKQDFQMKTISNWTGGTFSVLTSKHIANMSQIMDEIAKIGIEMPKVQASIKWTGVKASALSM